MTCIGTYTCHASLPPQSAPRQDRKHTLRHAAARTVTSTAHRHARPHTTRDNFTICKRLRTLVPTSRRHSTPPIQPQPQGPATNIHLHRYLSDLPPNTAFEAVPPPRLTLQFLSILPCKRPNAIRYIHHDVLKFAGPYHPFARLPAAAPPPEQDKGRPERSDTHRNPRSRYHALCLPQTTTLGVKGHSHPHLVLNPLFDRLLPPTSTLAPVGPDPTRALAPCPPAPNTVLLDNPPHYSRLYHFPVLPPISDMPRVARHCRRV